MFDVSNFGNEWSVRLNAKGMVYKHCALVGKVVSQVQPNILIWLYTYTGLKQLSKWMVDGGSPVFHCWGGRLQISKGKRLKRSVW